MVVRSELSATVILPPRFGSPSPAGSVAAGVPLDVSLVAVEAAPPSPDEPEGVSSSPPQAASRAMLAPANPTPAARRKSVRRVIEVLVTASTASSTVCSTSSCERMVHPLVPRDRSPGNTTLISSALRSVGAARKGASHALRYLLGQVWSSPPPYTRP